MKNKKFDFIIKSSRILKNRFKLDLFLSFFYHRDEYGYLDDEMSNSKQLKHILVRFNINDITTGLVCDPADFTFKQFKFIVNTPKIKIFNYVKKRIIDEYLLFLVSHIIHDKFKNFFKCTDPLIIYSDTQFNVDELLSSAITDENEIKLNVLGMKYYSLDGRTDKLSFNINWLSVATINKLLENFTNKSYYIKFYYFNNKNQKRICHSYVRINMIDICKSILKQKDANYEK